MNNALLAKIAGWGQLVQNGVGQIAAGGLPTTALGWISLIGSVMTAVGIHAAAKTDGVK